MARLFRPVICGWYSSLTVGARVAYEVGAFAYVPELSGHWRKRITYARNTLGGARYEHQARTGACSAWTHHHGCVQVMQTVRIEFRGAFGRSTWLVCCMIHNHRGGAERSTNLRDDVVN